MLDLAPVTTMLMPHVFASISNLVRSDPHCAVQVLSLIRAMLPSVASLNNLAAARNVVNGDAAAADSDDDMDDHGNQVRTFHNYSMYFMTWLSCLLRALCFLQIARKGNWNSNQILIGV